MATIAITGVAGLLGRRLVPALTAREDVDRIVGIDVRPPTALIRERAGGTPELVVRQADVRDQDLARALRGCDVLIHLAFRMDPMRDEALMREINVDGTRNVFEAAAAAGVRRILYPSSVAAYGAHPDNAVPLTEDSPLRGTPNLGYSEHKRDVERWLWAWLDDRPDLEVAVLRSAMVAGPGVENFMSRVVEQPRFLVVKGHKPPLQVVHVDDVVSGLLHALDQRLSGPYNLCAEGWLSFDEVRAIVGRPALTVPEEVAFAATERLWHLRIGEQPPGLVNHLMYPWVMSPQRLLDTGWAPAHSNRDAFAELVREHRSHIAVAGLRARRSTVRNVSLGVAGLAGLAAMAAVQRRRRSGH